ncbi:MAG: hypothetical protein K2X32_01000 [Phycisphaerales bacterium]|nr:hypothetical protein [Phycisphaerales bacterium]
MNPHQPASRARSVRAVAPLVSLASLACLGLAPSASAQEAMYTAAATMPSPGVSVVRQQFHYYKLGFSESEGFERAEKFEIKNSIQYGLIKDLSISLDAPIEFSKVKPINTGSESTANLDELDLTLKYRFYQDDPGGIDTTRMALLLGNRFRTDGRFSSDPHVGIVYTQVAGRHGFNAEAHYTFNTGSDTGAPNYGGEGDADAFNLNLAYVLRISPVEFTPESQGAWYVTAEINQIYELNGDYEARFSPGLMYEGRRWGFEIMAQIPIYTHLNNRARQQVALGLGWRYIF